MATENPMYDPDNDLHGELAHLICTKEGHDFAERAWAVLMKYGASAQYLRVAVRNFLGHSDIANYSEPPYQVKSPSD